MHQIQKPGKRKLALLFAFVALIVLVGWAIDKGIRSDIPPLSKVMVALPTQVSTGSFYVGIDQQTFKKRGLDVAVQPFLLGKDALQSVLQGKADLAVLADTPFMLSIMNGAKIATVATIFGSRKTMAIVGLKDHGITKAEDLRHKKIGTIAGTNAQYFVDTFLIANSISKSEVTIVNLKAGTLVEALRTGTVDAATVWHPDLANLQHAMGDGATTLYGEDIFVYRFLLVGTQAYLNKHPEEIRRLLAGLDDAMLAIRERPNEAQAVIGKSIGIAPGLLKSAFNPNDFYLTLDQTLLLALGAETRWAMKQGLIPAGEVPNYLNYIYQEPLKSVLPNAVKIIQ